MKCKNTSLYLYVCVHACVCRKVCTCVGRRQEVVIMGLGMKVGSGFLSSIQEMLNPIFSTVKEK